MDIGIIYIFLAVRVFAYLACLPPSLPPPPTTCHTRAECGECEQEHYIPHTTEVQQGEEMDAHPSIYAVCQNCQFIFF
jgi:hypothetical protein